MDTKSIKYINTFYLLILLICSNNIYANIAEVSGSSLNNSIMVDINNGYNGKIMLSNQSDNFNHNGIADTYFKIDSDENFYFSIEISANKEDQIHILWEKYGVEDVTDEFVFNHSQSGIKAEIEMPGKIYIICESNGRVETDGNKYMFVNIDIIAHAASKEVADFTLPSGNFRREIAPRIAIDNRQNDYIKFMDEDKFMETIEYTDDFGHPIQRIEKFAGGNEEHLVYQTEYDGYERVTTAWLPVATSSYVQAMISPEEVKQGARSQYSDNMPYNSTAYDGAMNRVLKQCGAGSAWNGRGVQTFYYVNTGTGSLSCAKYELSGKQLIRKGLYDTGDLVVVRTIDEDGHSRYDFSDKEGHTVLSRQINGGNYDTYYVYDDYGDLRYVLPPLAADQLNSNNVAYNIDNTQALIDYAYYYEYDNYGNCTMKKKPGAEKELFFYDKDHRLILSQNGVQRFTKHYTFYLYDIYGREVVRGTCKCAAYDNIKNRSIVATFTGDETSSILESGYAVIDFPFDSGSLLLENINYYDNYSFLTMAGFRDGDYSYKGLYDFDNLYMHPTNDKLSAKGLLTGSITGRYQTSNSFMEAIDTSIPQRFYKVFYYSEDAQVIQSIASNHLFGFEKDYFKYSFTGKLLKHRHEHSAKDKDAIVELYTYTYDRTDRLVNTYHSFNNSTPVLLSSLSYDATGRLKSKSLNDEKIPITYSYNIRNWLTDIQSHTFYQTLYYNASLSGGVPCYNGNISAAQWGYSSGDNRISKYTYDSLDRLIRSSYTEPRISDTTSVDKRPNFSEEFIYDKHGNVTGITNYGIIGEHFHLSTRGIGIIELRDYSYGIVNQLNLSYSGNQLKKVTNDISLNSLPKGTFYFTDEADKENEYSYDRNGNTTSDLNKKITSISYTNKNLPHKIELSSGESHTYRYDASGRKLRLTHAYTEIPIFHPVFNGISRLDTLKPIQTKVLDETDYCGNIIYENGKLSKILTDEGFVSFVNNTPIYYFYIKDHQGNNRLLTKSNVFYTKNYDYYAFGGIHNNNGESQDASSIGPIKPTATISQNYLFGGKEIDRMNGLDWYDFGARAQDPLLGRFMSIDPLCEKYYSISPYVYCNNNPINLIDPNGMDWYRNNKTLYYTWYDGNEEREGFTYIGDKGSALGEFESIIDDLLVNNFKVGSMYSDGFTFDIVNNNKGALIGSGKSDWDFFDEFVNGTGPEFSVFLSDHPYTQVMKKDKAVIEAQQNIINNRTDVPGQITAWKGEWGLWDALTTLSMAKQFIGSYRYDAFTSKNKRFLNNVISDSKSMSSFFYHISNSLNKRRYEQKIMGTTYQFYIWQSLKNK